MKSLFLSLLLFLTGTLSASATPSFKEVAVQDNRLPLPTILEIKIDEPTVVEIVVTNATFATDPTIQGGRLYTQAVGESRFKIYAEQNLTISDLVLELPAGRRSDHVSLYVQFAEPGGKGVLSYAQADKSASTSLEEVL